MKTLIQTISLTLILTLNLLRISQLQAQCHMNDWIALKALYENTDGDNWINNTGWEQVTEATPPESCDLGDMFGVTLQDGRVSSVILDANQLNGSIPLEIGNLTNLTELFLHNNQLSSFPPEIGNLTNLTELFLGGNPFSSLPSEIGNLTDLTTLNLAYNQLSSLPPEIGNLANLTTLVLSYNQLSSLPSEIGNLINLIRLDLADNQLSSLPPEIGNLINLIRLDLYNNQLSGCYDSNLSNLCTQLSPSYNTNTFISNGNNFDASWEDFCNTGAGICTCRQSDSLALVALYNSTNGPNWANTWNLNQPMNSWHGVTLDSSGCVTQLKLNNNGLTGTISSELGNLEQLNELSLQHNNLSGNIPNGLGYLTNLTRMFMHNNQISGNIPNQIGGLTNLTHLYLQNNSLNGSLPTELSSLTNLTHLALHYNQFTGNIPDELGDLINLVYLNLENNQLIGNIPSELGNLIYLTYLILDYNDLNGNIPPELGNLSNLTSLFLNSNQLSGCYDENLISLCSQLSTSSNTHISIGNNFDASWEDFCNTGVGTCSSDVLPGDCNGDGIVNTNDALYWGLAEGFNGTLRPNATTDCNLQASPDWSLSVNNVNSKHQDGDGNGIVDGDDLQILVSNFGCVNNYTTPNYTSAAPIYRVEPQGINSDGKYQYDLYIENGSGVAAIAHGLAFTVSSDIIPISAVAMSSTGSSLHPDEAFAITDGNRCHVVLTRTDNLDVICDGSIATFVVETGDIPVGVPFEIDVAYGSKIKADATLENVTGATAFGMYNGFVPSSSNIFLDASVTHEQCNGLGEALVIPSGGIEPYTYSWNNGANTAQVNNLTSGTYTVTVTDSNGLNQNLNLQINGQTPIYDANGNLLCGNLCPEYLAPSGITGNGLYSANNALNSDAIIPTGNTAHYKAGQIIELKSGFKVQPNAEFSAEIEDCQ